MNESVEVFAEVRRRTRAHSAPNGAAHITVAYHRERGAELPQCRAALLRHHAIHDLHGVEHVATGRDVRAAPARLRADFFCTSHLWKVSELRAH